MNDDQDLRIALHHAVDDVEPTEQLTAIRARTRHRVRTRWFAAGGSLLAAATAVAVVLAVTGPSSTTAADPAGDSGSRTPEELSTPQSVYYLGPGPSGPDAPESMLFRAIETGPTMLDLLMTTPSDPDYATRWPRGSLLSYEVKDAEIEVVVSDDAPVLDELARQQLVYTIQAYERSTLPVVLIHEVVEPSTGGPIESAPELDVLSHMSIDQPSEGAVVAREDGALVVTGRGNSFEASGQCSLLSEDGAEVGATLAQMDGWIESRLYPSDLSIDLADVPVGTYALTCITDDPTGGAEGPGTYTDTRTVIVE